MQIEHISSFLLRECQLLIFLPLLLLLVDFYTGIHAADLTRGVFIFAVAIWRFIQQRFSCASGSRGLSIVPCVVLCHR